MYAFVREKHYKKPPSESQLFAALNCLFFLTENPQKRRLEHLSMNAPNIIEAMKTSLLPLLEKTNSRKILLDNAKAHSSTLLRRFLEEKNIDYFEFGGHPIFAHEGYPPKSPDFNPIEAFFNDFNEMFNKEECKIVRELVNVAKHAWEKLPLEKLHSHIKHLPKNLKKAIHTNGDISRSY